MNNLKSKAGVLPVPSPKTLSTISTRRISEYCFLTVLVGLILTGCGPQPRFTSARVEEKKGGVVAEEKHGQKGKSKIDQAKMGRIVKSFLGVPYQYGGNTKSGIDCSGLVVQVYKQYAGFNLPRSTKKLYQLVKHVERDDLAYGDLVFFSDGWFSVSHVGIYLGDRQFVHSVKDSGVMVSSLDEDHYRKRYRGGRRVIP